MPTEARPATDHLRPPGDHYPHLAIAPADIELGRSASARRSERVDLSRTVIEIVAVRAAAEPDRVAIVGDDRRITYPQLVDEVRRLADDLVGAGCAAGDVVAVSGPRRPATVAAFLALELIGAVYLPIDTRWLHQRHTKDLLVESGVRIVVLPSDGATDQLGDMHKVRYRPDWTTRGDADGSGKRPPDTLGPIHGAHPQRVSYVIYTSGTTGRPKGALVEHRGMLNHLWGKVIDLGLTSADVVSFTAPVVFDISIWQMLAPLLVGGQVAVMPDADIDFPRRLAHRLATAEATVLEMVPTALRWFLAALRRVPAGDRLPRLRHLVATGEALPMPLAVEATQTLPQASLINAYGPTECSDDVTHHVFATADAAGRHVPIGSCVPNTALYLLTEEGGQWHACPPGAVGELFVGGLGVGRGYLNDPERTRAAFFADPFDCESPTGRIYRTGDLARQVTIGTFEYLGRVDRQVKIAGIRIELGEIEAALAEHPQIRQCAVTFSALSNSEPEPQLVAHYVADIAFADGELDAFLRQRLPAVVVPRRWRALAELPLTSNGKVDHRELAGAEPERKASLTLDA